MPADTTTPEQRLAEATRRYLAADMQIVEGGNASPELIAARAQADADRRAAAVEMAATLEVRWTVEAMS